MDSALCRSATRGASVSIISKPIQKIVLSFMSYIAARPEHVVQVLPFAYPRGSVEIEQFVR